MSFRPDGRKIEADPGDGGKIRARAASGERRGTGLGAAGLARDDVDDDLADGAALSERSQALRVSGRGKRLSIRTRSLPSA